jgi:dTDP-4-amino-4,6-dideoxygalactose transaminase
LGDLGSEAMRMTSPATILLHRRLSRLFKRDHVTLFGRARAGLVAVVEECGGAGIAVLMPSNICPAVLAAVVGAGGTPCLVPVSPLSGLADEQRFLAALKANSAPCGIVMPTHLYGFWSDYSAVGRLARDRGWMVLENDCLASLAVDDGGPAPIGDALLVSFGSGKTIDAGGGGAILTNDPRLAKALERRSAAWHELGAADSEIEGHLTQARRALRALGKAGLAEHLLSVDLAHLRHAFDETHTSQLAAVLDRFREDCEERRLRLEVWRRVSSGLGDELRVLSTDVMAPWRLIGRARNPDRRDLMVSALRRKAIDAGINFPPLTDCFPKLLGDQRHADADEWGDSVINLWLSADYDNRRIDQAAAILAKVLGKTVP